MGNHQSKSEKKKYLQSYYQAGATADVDPFVTMMTGDLA